ncbi:nucleoporin subcomplex protein binding to Pom34-domain-containing protein [Dendryphion nanum]|uniref:Nucleoporin NUP188 n=1 Tax=Dendryphion nanum TaxID=256645 RepID=A0A9P9IV61_9PLEO|nr:nucleoporin subcomplex protein binding to Pom34-domain-containing protein [Dendryphion nanum]
MAPVHAQSHNDLDLAKCFNGEQHLISWSSAYIALCDPETASKSSVLREFLSDEANIDILTSPWKPFVEPSSVEKTLFDTKTAPINVTPSSIAPYSIEDIKADALWLSQQAKISEAVALRLVVLEWQNRPTVQLLTGYAEEEALSMRDAAGLANLGASTFIPNASILSTLPTQSSAQFDSVDQRRLRIIEIYHSTRIAILRISQLLVSWGAAAGLRLSRGQEYCVNEDWLEKLGRDVASRQTQKTPNVLDSCISSIRETTVGLRNGVCLWAVSEETQDVAAVQWLDSQHIELVHLLHLAIVHADLLTKKFVATQTVELWFNFLHEQGFYVGLAHGTPIQQHMGQLIRGLVSLLSLAILKPNLVIDDIMNGKHVTWDDSCYILNAPLLETMTKIFGNAKDYGTTPATIPTFAWALISFRICSEASDMEQVQQRQIEFTPGASLPAPSALQKAATSLTRPDLMELFDNELPYKDLAESSLQANLLNLITTTATSVASDFGTDVDRISLDSFRFLLLHLLRDGVGSFVLPYETDTFNAIYVILVGSRSFRQWTEDGVAQHADPLVSFCVQDSIILRDFIFDETDRRYPVEIPPFLQLYSALVRGSAHVDDGMVEVTKKLGNFRTVTQRLPDQFNGYQSVREEENDNHVQLTVDLPQFSIQGKLGLLGKRRLLGHSSQAATDVFMVIPAGTLGRIVDDSAHPFVAKWLYDHSALDYMSQLLTTYVVGSKKVEYSSQQPASLDTVSGIIGLFADLLYASLQTHREDNSAIDLESILGNLDISVDRDQDVASVILSIFDQELLRQCQEPGNMDSLTLLVNCVHFVQSLVKIAPNRVWPWLARSRLLENSGNGGSLASILISTEMVLGHYDFLIGCIDLFHALVVDAVGQSVVRKSRRKSHSSQLVVVRKVDSGISSHIMSEILLRFGTTLASIYEGSPTFRYSRQDDRAEINIGICEAFTAVLKYAYAVDHTLNLSEKLTGLIAPLANYITELYLSATENDLLTNPILTSFVSSVEADITFLSKPASTLWRRQTQSALVFSNILVRVAHLLGRPSTYLEHQLFKATPLLARLYAANVTFKPLVVQLLDGLVRGAVRATTEGTDQIEPPSLLGHLGPKAAKNFLSILSQLDEPFKVIELQTKVWTFLSAVVSCKQQWFALYLLTGNTPREAVKMRAGTASENSRSKALLSRAINTLSKLDLEQADTNWTLYTAMLEFISSAQNNWAWAMGDLVQHKELIHKLLAFLKWMATQPQDHKTHPQDLDATRSHQNKFAAFACQVLAMYLHGARQRGDSNAVKDIVPCLTYLEAHALETPLYNRSVHVRLDHNFKNAFPDVQLDQLKRTSLHTLTFGPSYFYDTELANELLKFNSQWHGPPTKNGGVISDLERANLNFGLVESQIELLRSWKLLATELSSHASNDPRLVKILATVVKSGMRVNTEERQNYAQDNWTSQTWVGDLDTLRADLVFVLLQRMVNARARVPEVRQLLPVIWSTIHTSVKDFDHVYSGDQVDYYRSLARILYLSLQFFLLDDTATQADVDFRSSFRGSVPASYKTLEEPLSTLLLEILSDVVAKGFRSLATQLHSRPDTVSPSDFALLTAILQTILIIPEMKPWHAQAALLFTNSNTLRYATSLFSWSDKITISNGRTADPVYGELSLLFILSLSTMQPLAESMAVEGILSQLNGANIMNTFRRPRGVSPFDTPSRLFSIWAKGILPLCLNLLSAVGPPISGEISAFLNQFPEQLNRASNSLNSRVPIKITLSIASEVHSLALISSVLESNRVQGPQLGIQASDIAILDWDKDNVKEDIDGWMARKGALREKIVPLDEIDTALLNKSVEGQDWDNLLEAKVLRELIAAADCLGLEKTSAS